MAAALVLSNTPSVSAQRSLALFSDLGLTTASLEADQSMDQAKSSQNEYSASVNNFQFVATDAGIQAQWQLFSDQPANRNLNALVLLESLPKYQFGGFELPMVVQPVLLPDDVKNPVEIDSVDSSLWQNELTQAVPLVPTAIGWETDFMPLEPEPLMLPTAPAFILREGRIRGQRVGVVAFSPLFESEGATQVAYGIDLLVPGAKPIDELSSLYTQAPHKLTDFLSVSGVNLSRPPVYTTMLAEGVAVRPASAASEELRPSNQAAMMNSVRIKVTDVGIQKISGTQLLESGYAQNSNLNMLHLWYQGQEVPLAIADSDLLLDSNTEIRFYAAPRCK